MAPVVSRWGAWYLFGAQAVIAHGVPRLSADVDVTLRMQPNDPLAFTRDMHRAGFDAAVDDPEFVRKTRVLPFVHRQTAMPLDVVLASSGLEDEFLARAKPANVGGATVPLIDVEDLIVAKVLAGREKDIEDARNLWRVRGSGLDADRVRGVLRLLEEALGQGDLVRTFDGFAGRGE